MFHRMTPEQWNEVIDTNLTGVFNTVTRSGPACGSASSAASS
jgi:NAD(P)-dependent dehydrogenase (short-subunit alcohol dehydrogenase family)